MLALRTPKLPLPLLPPVGPQGCIISACGLLRSPGAPVPFCTSAGAGFFLLCLTSSVSRFHLLSLFSSAPSLQGVLYRLSGIWTCLPSTDKNPREKRGGTASPERGEPATVACSSATGPGSSSRPPALRACVLPCLKCVQEAVAPRTAGGRCHHGLSTGARGGPEAVGEFSASREPGDRAPAQR